MARFLLQRLGLALAVALTASVVTFLLLNVAVDPAAALVGETDDPMVIVEMRERLGLDRPIVVRYGEWLGGVLTGNMGDSYVLNRPVLDAIMTAAPVTIKLALSATLVAMLVAIPLGVLAGLRPGGIADRIGLSFAAALQATPNFWLGLLCIIGFAVQLKWVPVSGDDSWRHFILPALILGTDSIPNILRLTRAGVIEAMGADFIRTARAKGFRGFKLLRRHVLRNALLPVVSVLAIQLGNKLGGSVVTEVVFSMNGLGQLALQSVLRADVPTLQMLVMIFAFVFVIMVFVSDLLNAWLDPRIRLQ
ncbi:ABC transporter permease [Cereibacter changlensis]|uniref:ABC transporter permease n=1 Tax=Cereibacter changlensis TaxID=402884 RepID=A0A4U0YY43_9RHOB|nr:ABC transporter permease [Cereibacter changlensis]TKA96718.1 ABC transporter permease [Cereibacter changlensis]